MNVRSIPQAGFSINEFCAGTGLGRTTVYALPPHLQPKRVKIGERTIIIESPASYLARIAAEQGAAIPKVTA